MFQITSTKSIHQVYTKCIHQVYLKYTQCSILHVCSEYIISIFHFVKGTLVLKKMSGPTEVKGLMYSCIIKLHVCITHFRKLYI